MLLIATPSDTTPLMRSSSVRGGRITSGPGLKIESPASGGLTQPACRLRRRGLADLASSARRAVRRRRTGGDHGDPDFVAEVVVDDGAEDDVGILVRGILDLGGRIVDLEQTQIRTAGDGEQHARAPSMEASSSGELMAARRPSSTRPSPRADPTPSGRAGVAHDTLHVGEVDIDKTRRGDEVGDALHAVEEDLVGAAESVHRG